jgi:hypothetical protein
MQLHLSKIYNAQQKYRKWGLNPRHLDYDSTVLPLNYSENTKPKTNTKYLINIYKNED